MCQFNEVTDICQWPPVIRIISVLHSHRLSSGKSALSSQFRSAAVTIAVHRCGDEAGWWNKIGIDPTTAARVLWRETHPLPRTTGQPTAKLTNPMCRPALHEFLPQIEVNRRLRTEPGKQASRCNAVRHGLTAETMAIAFSASLGIARWPKVLRVDDLETPRASCGKCLERRARISCHNGKQ